MAETTSATNLRRGLSTSGIEGFLKTPAGVRVIAAYLTDPDVPESVEVYDITLGTTNITRRVRGFITDQRFRVTTGRKVMRTIKATRSMASLTVADVMADQRTTGQTVLDWLLDDRWSSTESRKGHPSIAQVRDALVAKLIAQ